MSEISCNEFIKRMREAGFTGKFRATNGSQVITGEIKKEKVETVKVTTSEESRQKIKAMFRGN